MASPNRTMKLPRLRTKDELLKTSPELFGKLLLGDEMSTARSSTSAPQQSSSKSLRPVQSAGRSTSSSSMHRTVSRGGHIGAAYDTPRGFGDEPMSVDQELAIELESVKRERQQLMESISQVKAEAGTAGGEAQQADISQLLKELEMKKAKLNELRGDSRKAEADIAKIRDEDVDAQRLTPDGCVVENSYIQGLHDEMSQVEDDLLEADAKNRLYQLLGERTRQEHMALDQKVRDKQDCLRACMEDLANLTDHFNSVRAAKELAQKELAKTKRQVEEARNDWTRKIRERRAEVTELQRRQRKDHEKEVRRRERLQEKEKAERAAQARLKMEQEAYQLQVAALAPKIEAMEASWNRLRAISGAETPEQVIDYWQGLQAKEARMRDLVALAEQREAACKEQIGTLLASRSNMYEAAPAVRRNNTAAAAAAGGKEGQQEQQPEVLAEDDEDECEETVEAAAAKIEEAARRMEAAQAQFSKLRGICVAAEQGMRSLAQRLSLAFEAPALTIGPSASAHDAATAAGPVPGAGSRLTSAASGLSSASGSHAADAGGRRSGPGSSSMGSAQHHRRPSREHGMDSVAQQQQQGSALASKAQRLNSNRARGHPESASSAGAGAGSGLALVPEDSAGSRQRSNGPLQEGSLAASSSRAVLPSRGRNTIDDDSFFEGLPQLLTDVTDKLEKLLSAGHGFDLSAIAAAAEQAGMLSSGYSSAASTARRRSGANSDTAEPTPRGAAIKAMHAGLLPQAAAAAAPRASIDAGVAARESTAEADRASQSQSAADVAAEGRVPAAEAAAEPAAVADPVAAEAETRPASAVAADEGDTAGEAAAAGSGSDATQSEQQQPEAAAGDGSSGMVEAPEAAAADGSGAVASAEASSTQQQEPSSVADPAAGAVGDTSAGVPAAPTTPAAPAAAAPAVAAGSFNATQSPTASIIRTSAASSILLNEKALQKGLHRRTWVGAPWMDAVSDNPLDMSLLPSMKRKKGKKRADARAAGPDLSRILGYIPPGDVPAESESDGDDGAAAGEAVSGGMTMADGVVDRDYIKMRAAKITARHNAKAAAAAAQSQGGR